MPDSGDQRGRYTIIRSIGTGRLSTVYEVRNPETGKIAVLKELSMQRILQGHPEIDWLHGPQSLKIVELFQREARVLEALDHPGIPAYIEHFEHKTDTDRFLCLVQERVSGLNLQDRLAQGVLTQEQVVDVATRVSEILEYLHGLTPPVIHRDIKTSNIIRSDDGEVHVIDFGAVADEPETTGTGGSTIIGTFGFMPMEQFEGRSTPASDVYALGATVVHLLTGTHPRKLPRMGMRIDLTRLGVGSHFGALLSRMLDPDPSARPPDGATVRRALEVVARRSSDEKPQPPAKPPPSRPLATTPIVECPRCITDVLPGPDGACPACGQSAYGTGTGRLPALTTCRLTRGMKLPPNCLRCGDPTKFAVVIRRGQGAIAGFLTALFEGLLAPVATPAQRVPSQDGDSLSISVRCCRRCQRDSPPEVRHWDSEDHSITLIVHRDYERAVTQLNEPDQTESP